MILSHLIHQPVWSALLAKPMPNHPLSFPPLPPLQLTPSGHFLPRQPPLSGRPAPLFAPYEAFSAKQTQRCLENENHIMSRPCVKASQDFSLRRDCNSSAPVSRCRQKGRTARGERLGSSPCEGRAPEQGQTVATTMRRMTLHHSEESELMDERGVPEIQ